MKSVRLVGFGDRKGDLLGKQRSRLSEFYLKRNDYNHPEKRMLKSWTPARCEGGGQKGLIQYVS